VNNGLSITQSCKCNRVRSRLIRTSSPIPLESDTHPCHITRTYTSYDPPPRLYSLQRPTSSHSYLHRHVAVVAVLSLAPLRYQRQAAAISNSAIDCVSIQDPDSRLLAVIGASVAPPIGVRPKLGRFSRTALYPGTQVLFCPPTTLFLLTLLEAMLWPIHCLTTHVQRIDQMATPGQRRLQTRNTATRP